MSENSHDDHHEITLKTFSLVLGALLFLTFITVWIAQFDFGAANMFIAMFVASIKAGLVLLYFMHLKYDSNMNRSVFLIGVFFLVVMFAFSYGDIITRLPEASTL